MFLETPPVKHLVKSRIEGLRLTLQALNKYNKYNLDFHPLEVVSRYRDPQLQVGENYSCFLIEVAHGSWKLLIILSFYPFFCLAICFLEGKNDINIDKNR